MHRPAILENRLGSEKIWPAWKPAGNQVSEETRTKESRRVANTQAALCRCSTDLFRPHGHVSVSAMLASVLKAHRKFKLAWDRLRRLPWTLEYEAVLAEPDRRSRFDRIYRRKIWSRIAKHGESASGEGSSFDKTTDFRTDLQRFMQGMRPGVFLDAPCGDLNFMRHVRFPPAWDYIGADIAPSLIRDLKRQFPAMRFREFDLVVDQFPATDVWLCRDCFFHFSYADIHAALENFARSAGNIAIITSNTGITGNTDIRTGDFRRLDLTLPPFNFPTPAIALRDLPGQIAGVWTRAEIAAALDNFIRPS